MLPFETNELPEEDEEDIDLNTDDDQIEVTRASSFIPIKQQWKQLIHRLNQENEFSIFFYTYHSFFGAFYDKYKTEGF